ncbi:S9 family peptidase [Rarobacter incanus]|uniref:Oligopeptidase B n=1 Tax=Rarobacter incanus TaxID=153494 RepID=A0A542SRS9_9MICO|nr:S9 family peptidase [Rarobacter incanus]TQK77312.1 oligopeptidase B [Rarobacter incanus]
MTNDNVPTAPPVAAKRPTTRTFHGDSFVDNYEWLRDAQDPATIDYLNAENAWTDARTAHLAPLRETLFNEIKSRTRETDMSLPLRSGPWWYFGRTTEGKQYGTQCRVPVTDPTDWNPPTIEPGNTLDGEQVIFDANEHAQGHDFFSIGAFSLDATGRFLVYGTDTTGDERYTVRIQDLNTGEHFPEVIENTGGNAVITPDGSYVFYTTVDESWRPDTVWRHRVGTDPSTDKVVYHEQDERFWVGTGFTRTERFLVVEASSKITSETRLIDLTDPTCDPIVVCPRADGVEYSIEHGVRPDGTELLAITHNARFADFEIVLTDVPTGEPIDLASGVSVLTPATGERIEAVDIFRDYLVVSYRSGALPRIAILDAAAALSPNPEPWTLIPVSFGDELSATGIGSNPEYDQPLLRIGFGSFITPAQIIDLDVASGTPHVRKTQEILGGYDPADYGQARLWARAEDGTEVPISIVWKRSAVNVSIGPDGVPVPARTSPLRLYGYGAYEASMDPGVSVARLSSLDRGVIFAIAHVRGGGEMGRAWYEQGRMLNKKNSFTDFVSCARHLVDAGWTVPEKMVAEGGSAGGLLMGAVANLAPELFAGIVADVPFVDALTSILDPALPLTVIEWDEWGDPLHNPEVYQYMRSYTPYENVRDGARYPRILAVTSLNDTRVLFVEPAKWTARLREAGVDVLLKTEMSAGHGGVSGRYAKWREVAFEMAWTLDVLGATALPPVK